MFKGKLGTLLLKLLFKLIRRSSPANIPANMRGEEIDLVDDEATRKLIGLERAQSVPEPEEAPQSPVPRSNPQPRQPAPPKASSRPRPVRRGGRATYISTGGHPRK